MLTAIDTTASPAEDTTLAGLRSQRPGLVAPYLAALPRARAEVLARLWGACWREPLPGIQHRRVAGDTMVVTFAGGRRISGPDRYARPFAAAPPQWSVTLLVEGASAARFDHPAPLLAALGQPGYEHLAHEVDNSVANLALAYAAAPHALPGVDASPGHEHLVVAGHPLHPCCRTRSGFSTGDVLAYAPEHRPVVRLRLLAVPDRRLLQVGDFAVRLLRDHPDLVAPPGHALLPLHPWQVHRTQVAGTLVDADIPATPLMSLRTLAPADPGAHHVKTALSAQMTSAVRIVSPAAVRNGPLLTAVLRQILAEQGRYGGTFAVLGEPAAASVLVDGEPSRELGAILRDPPSRHVAPGEFALPVAALSARSRRPGRPLLVAAVDRAYPRRPDAPVRWLASFTSLVAPPLLHLLSHYGIALEAHGQNTLVVLRGGRPVRLLYRDLGGIRVSPLRLASRGMACDQLAGHLPSDDPTVLRTKLFASLVATQLAELVAVLAGEYGIEPPVLWAAVARALRATYAELPGDARTAADEAALFGARLPMKALTAMRLANDPLADLWTSVPNPLDGLR